MTSLTCYPIVSKRVPHTLSVSTVLEFNVNMIELDEIALEQNNPDDSYMKTVFNNSKGT